MQFKQKRKNSYLAFALQMCKLLGMQMATQIFNILAMNLFEF